ncbi:MAG: TraR/DksA family transcriptional regulator [Spirochaetales bacterium]|nr:TraR/DksA family transcriptional regulator [Spirochaetales bacterium]
MDKKFIDQMKAKLEEMRTEILKILAAEDEAFNELITSDEVKDIADTATSDIDSRTLAILGMQDLKRLRLIDSALIRIANGTYGRCLKSGKPIGRERLEAVPYALYTIEVQNEIDRKKRRVS